MSARVTLTDVDEVLIRRPDRVTRSPGRLSREHDIISETLALFVRYFLVVTPPVPDDEQDAARALGLARFECFVTQLAERVAGGRALLDDVLEETQPVECDFFAVAEFTDPAPAPCAGEPSAGRPTMRDAGAARSAAMLRTAMGAEVSRALANPHFLEITVNPDGCFWLDPAIQGRVDTGVCLTRSAVGQIDRLVASQAGQAPGADHPIVSAELPATDERFEGVHAADSLWSLLLNPSTDQSGHRPRCLCRDQCLDPYPGGPAAAAHPDPSEHPGDDRCLLEQDDARQRSLAQDARPRPPRRAAVILREHKLYAARCTSIYRRGDLMKLNFSWVPGQMATEELLRDCASLYSKHYGFWGQSSSTLAGKRVRLSSTRLRNWLNDKDSKIALAYDDAELVGYAIAVQTKVPRYGFISWVIQFVVHEDYRRRNVGKTLLFSIWGFTDHFAWGLLTASPYAVRALEKATRRRCDPARIKKNCRKLYSVGRVHVPYVTEETNIEISSGSTGQSRIRTGFCLDHSDLNKRLAQVTTKEKPWRLGPIEEGWEWFAFTFADQEQLRLTSEELNSMLEASDQITVQAYSRMLLNSEHHWAQHACKESCEIVEYCQIKPGQSVLDLGCGIGRHTIRLAKLGARVTGVDYVEAFVEKAKSQVPQQLVHEPCFILADCRDVKLEQCFDAVLCLYDRHRHLRRYRRKHEDTNQHCAPPEAKRLGAAVRDESRLDQNESQALLLDREGTEQVAKASAQPDHGKHREHLRSGLLLARQGTRVLCTGRSSSLKEKSFPLNCSSEIAGFQRKRLRRCATKQVLRLCGRSLSGQEDGKSR